MNCKLNILLVEDNPGDADIIQEMIFETNLHDSIIMNAYTLNEAFALCKEQKFDVILLDLGLPDSTGLITLTKFLEFDKKVPIVVLTGHEDEVMALDTIREGAQDYITKNDMNSNILGRVLRYAIERKRTLEALRIGEYKFRSLVNEVHDGIYNSDKDGNFTFVNKALCSLLGYREDELVGKPFSTLIIPDKRDKLVEQYKQTFIGGKSSGVLEVPVIREDGTSLIIEIKPVIQYENGKPIGSRGVVRDVTERKQWEQQLQISENRYRSFVENFHGIAFRSWSNGIPIYFHGAIKEITGYTEAELVNGYPRWDEIIYNNDRERLMEPAVQNRILSEGYDAEREYRIVCKNGKIKWVHDYLQTVYDYTRGQVILQGAIYDVTERKKAEEELNLNRERLKITNSILRHDITNDLAVISSAVDIFRNEHDEEMIDEIDKRVKKCMGTIRKQSAKESAIGSQANLDEYKIDHIIKDIAQNYKNIKINISGTGRAYADQSIYSVFENIISNAVKHSKTSLLDIGISYVGNFCEITIADWGVGIPDEIKGKVFEEGFHFGRNGHTGIGLHIVKKTIEDYAGEVFIKDNKPEGTIFVVRLKRGVEN